MDQRTPVEEWFPGPQKIDQPYPIINDTSGIPLKAELVVPPPDQVSQSGSIECLGVLKLPMPDPKHWVPDGSYVTVKISPSPAESHQSSPSCGSICDGNSEKNYWYGETLEDGFAISSEVTLEGCSEQNPAELCAFEEYSKWMCPARKLNVDGEGDFLYFLIGGQPINMVGRLKLSFRVYIHAKARYQRYCDGTHELGVEYPPEELWMNGFLPDPTTVYYTAGVFIPSVQIDMRPEAGVQRQNILTEQQRDLVEKLKKTEIFDTPLYLSRMSYLHAPRSPDSGEELRGRSRTRGR